MTFSNNKSLIEVNIKTTLAAWLFVSCLLIMSIGATSWRALNSLHKQIENIVRASELKTSLVYDMRIFARERNLSLMLTVLSDDAFMIDDEYMRFRELGSEFLIAREKFIALGLNEKEKQLLEEQRDISVNTVAIQYQILDYVKTGDKVNAARLASEAFHYQKKVFEKINELLLVQKQENQIKIEEARLNKTNVVNKIVYLSIVVALIMLAMTAYIIKRLSEQAKNIRNEALKFKALIEGSIDAVMIVNEREVIDCNSNALKMFSVNSLNELNDIGLDFISRFSEDVDQEKDMGIFNAINHALVNVKRHYEWDFISLKGCIFPAEVELTGIEIDGMKYVQIIIRDVTEREIAEEELRKANENLEQKVRIRTEELNDLNSKIAGIARSAGMAEVASGVLHNVGNVLNSVNVSTSILRSQIESDKTKNLSKLVSMIEDNSSHISAYLSEDEKGKLVIPYLKGLSDQLVQDRSNQLIEINSLIDNVEHIKNIVTMQQAYTGSLGVIEMVQASVVMEDAININMSGTEKNEIELKREFLYDPVMSVDKHKLMQVLVNLISNARHALSNLKGFKKITVGMKQSGENIIFYVEDNGVGIAKEDITRLFEFGFKKREGGHGYGLHHSALMAKDLCGKISVKSEGLGKGARFELSVSVSN